jgi:hypothetical protein
VASPDSDLYKAQPITFESMRRAKAKAERHLNIELYSAQFEEDAKYVPDYFIKTQHLSRSVLDMATFHQKIKLPLIADILVRLYTESAADYLIYTNVDIGLYEDFYLKVNEFIHSGLDAFIINRRRLMDTFESPDELNTIYLNKGLPHPGFDCFVFHRSLYSQLKLEGICIGVPFIEIAFSQNLFALSNNFKLFDKEILTFHIGEEIFKKRAPKEYYTYNRKQFWKIAGQLFLQMDVKKIPYSDRILPLRLLKWGLHPCFPIRLLLKLELKRLKFL